VSVVFSCCVLEEFEAAVNLLSCIFGKLLIDAVYRVRKNCRVVVSLLD
jgi:hypothetical protein